MYPSTPVQALISEAGLVPAQILLDHRQRMYTYRLLTLPDDHITKKILPISFRKGDADTISADEQPEDTLIWAGNERPTTLSQWLARQIATKQAVDSAFGLEPIERSWRWSNEVPLQVVLQLEKRHFKRLKKNEKAWFFGQTGQDQTQEKLELRWSGLTKCQIIGEKNGDIWEKIKIRLMRSYGPSQMP